MPNSTPHITEPMTMVTDYFLTALCVALAIALLRKAGTTGRRAIALWVVSFLVAATAAFAGGTAHGFKLYLGDTHGIIWKFTVYAIGLTAILMLIAGIRSAKWPTTTNAARRTTGHKWLKAGLGLSAVGVLIQRTGIGFHEHFNHNDIYHFIQMLGIYCFYRGALYLHDLIEES
jgi:hypothetical protein